MYVEWLLEFVWRIFIQGPLMFINFFTSTGNINKLSSTIGFTNKEIPIVNSLISTSAILAIAVALLIMIFIFKVIKIIVISKEDENKALIINALKEFAKSIVIILVFSLIFVALFALFDVFARALDKAYNSVEEGLSSPISKIPNILYQFVSGQSIASNNKNFLFPPDLLTTMDSMNWIFSIILVMSFAFFLLWIVWSIFQKMLEILFLYLSFPISVSFGLDNNQIHWKIWVKEIINKIALIFVMMLFLRLFLYMFYFISDKAIINEPRWSSRKMDQIYLAIFVTLALGGSMMFMIKMFSLKHFEHVGLIGSINSFKQTRNFITQNSMQTYSSTLSDATSNVNLEPLNENVDSLKHEINSLNNNVNLHYEDLKKAKVFSK